MLQCLYYRDVKLQRFVPLRHDEAPSLTSVFEIRDTWLSHRPEPYTYT